MINIFKNMIDKMKLMIFNLHDPLERCYDNMECSGIAAFGQCCGVNGTGIVNGEKSNQCMNCRYYIEVEQKELEENKYTDYLPIFKSETKLKPIRIDHFGSTRCGTCPNCHHISVIDNPAISTSICGVCHQQLDWSNSEEVSDSDEITKNTQTDSIKFRDKGCLYCMNGRIKKSYQDGNNMTAFIHESKPNENGYKSLAYWITVNCHDESQEFYIEFCPWCGKRLVPFNPDDCNQKSCD